LAPPRLDDREKSRVVYRIGIFRSVLVGISRYLPYQYRRKYRSVHFGIIFLAGTPFPLKKGALAPFLRKKGAPAPFLILPAPLSRKKRSSRQISDTDRKWYRPPSKSDTGKIPMRKKLLVRPLFTVDVVAAVDASTTATASLCRPYNEKK
jgi:hypothetical protein